MERHIQLENQYLWPKASRQLDDAEKKRLLEAFQRIERDELGEGFHEKYHSMAMALLAP